MTADERNFRSSYYEKVGCYSVEEKKSLNKLLQDNVRNQQKLKQFCFSYTVPAAQRALLWGLILGIWPLHKNSMDYVMHQRTAVYEDLLRAVTKLQFCDQSTPKSKRLYTMWLLENDQMYPNADAQEDGDNFMEIVKVLLQVFDNDVETYWIAKEFYTCSKEIWHECAKLKELTQTLLKREDRVLYNHLEKLEAFSSSDVLDKWYATCFAGIINESALIKIWDKICGGSRKIVVFVFIELMKAYREPALSCSTRKDLKMLIEQVKDQDAATVNKAIKTWQSNKNHSEIPVH